MSKLNFIDWNSESMDEANNAARTICLELEEKLDNSLSKILEIYKKAAISHVEECFDEILCPAATGIPINDGYANDYSESGVLTSVYATTADGGTGLYFSFNMDCIGKSYIYDLGKCVVDEMENNRENKEEVKGYLLPIRDELKKLASKIDEYFKDTP